MNWDKKIFMRKIILIMINFDIIAGIRTSLEISISLLFFRYKKMMEERTKEQARRMQQLMAEQNG